MPTPELIELIRLAGSLHDLGKLAIPEEILRKPAPLTEAERLVLERHPQIGFRMLESLGVDPVADWVLHHHERWDGAGYPDGLPAERIPLGARIIFVADAYDAMTSDRVYRRRLSTARRARRAPALRRDAVRPGGRRGLRGGARRRSAGRPALAVLIALVRVIRAGPAPRMIVVTGHRERAEMMDVRRRKPGVGGTSGERRARRSRRVLPLLLLSSRPAPPRLTASLIALALDPPSRTSLVAAGRAVRGRRARRGDPGADRTAARRDTISLSAVFFVGTAVLFGPAEAVVLAVGVRLTIDVAQRRPQVRLLYNGPPPTH